MLRSQLFQPTQYDMIAGWWTRHGWPPVNQAALSEIGLLVYDDDTPLCAGWLYLMTKYWALIEWVVVNPDAPRKRRAVGVELLLERLVSEAKFFNVQAIFTSLKSSGLIRLYQRQGFKITDTGMSNLVLTVGGQKCQSPQAPQLPSEPESQPPGLLVAPL